MRVCTCVCGANVAREAIQSILTSKCAEWRVRVNFLQPNALDLDDVSAEVLVDGDGSSLSRPHEVNFGLVVLGVKVALRFNVEGEVGKAAPAV